jgi:hypothetical protein
LFAIEFKMSFEPYFLHIFNPHKDQNLDRAVQSGIANMHSSLVIHIYDTPSRMPP